jgi:hypothetical protein
MWRVGATVTSKSGAKGVVIAVRGERRLYCVVRWPSGMETQVWASSLTR